MQGRIRQQIYHLLLLISMSVIGASCNDSANPFNAVGVLLSRVQAFDTLSSKLFGQIVPSELFRDAKFSYSTKEYNIVNSDS